MEKDGSENCIGTVVQLPALNEAILQEIDLLSEPKGQIYESNARFHQLSLSL